MNAQESDYRSWFESVCGWPPYRWQLDLASAAQTGNRIIRIPTGLGKTEGVLGTWLYHAVHQRESDWPRRLVWCLPMRVLVEQTAERARKLVAGWASAFARSDKPGVHILMGGEDADDWDLYPERHAILIGTQDMLLSRALNRGYGMSRYRWPIDFALLNNDCLWVFDEVQLMDVGVATSAQLEAFRRKLGAFLPAQSIWMSATLDPRWLQTVDVDPSWLGEPLTLSETDQSSDDGELGKRYGATKQLSKASSHMGDETGIAEEIAIAHQPGALTLAVFNTVERARNVYAQLRKQQKKKNGAVPEDVSLVLIHSRFRPPDRAEKVQQLLAAPPKAGTIAITTQVVEAGVDVSAKTLFTELAPWASLVQRFGRCNRRGEFGEEAGARVVWIDLPEEPKLQEKLAAPYALAQMLEAREVLVRCNDVGPRSLDSVQVPMRLEPDHVIRRRDFIDLFDTTPDLAGNDIDVSRFIRSGEELDVHVFWRDVPKDVSQPEVGTEYAGAPHRDELCAVPHYSFRSFLRKHRGNVWRWDGLTEQWVDVDNDHVYPGQVFLVRASAGGYTAETGFDDKQKKAVAPIRIIPAVPESYDQDRFSAVYKWQTLAEHADEVCRTVQRLVSQLGLDAEFADALLIAARWHDYGKAHPIFQAALPDSLPQQTGNGIIWAKASGKWKRYQRKHFRHELASALGILSRPHGCLQKLSPESLNLVAYLVAAHHGKVRLSIRSLPGENEPDRPEVLYARGVWDGDQLPQVDLGGGITAPPVRLSLQPMQLGRDANGEPSWAERMLALRDAKHMGPLRLAYLEAVLRAADMRVSRAATETTEASNHRPA